MNIIIITTKTTKIVKISPYEVSSMQMGGSFQAKENQILTALVIDSVNYGSNEKQALEYIKVRLGREMSTMDKRFNQTKYFFIKFNYEVLVVITMIRFNILAGDD